MQLLTIRKRLASVQHKKGSLEIYKYERPTMISAARRDFLERGDHLQYIRVITGIFIENGFKPNLDPPIKDITSAQ